jgi:hypothetical protein
MIQLISSISDRSRLHVKLLATQVLRYPHVDNHRFLSRLQSQVPVPYHPYLKLYSDFEAVAESRQVTIQVGPHLERNTGTRGSVVFIESHKRLQWQVRKSDEDL